MKKIRVVCDVDGVLADFVGPYSKLFPNHVWGDFTEEEKEFWNNPKYDFWANQPVITDLYQFEQVMRNCEVIFLTNTAHAAARRDWLKKHGFLKDRTLIVNPPGESKYNILKLLKPDVFIDDYGKNVKDGKRAGVPVCIKFDNKVVQSSWANVEEDINSLKQYCGEFNEEETTYPWGNTFYTE